MLMYNLIKDSGTHSKPSEILWQYYRDESPLDNNNNIIGFSANNDKSISLNFKQHK